MKTVLASLLAALLVGVALTSDRADGQDSAGQPSLAAILEVFKGLGPVPPT